MKRYQIVTYSRDSGENEKLEYETIAEAYKVARRYMRDKYYSGVMVWDKKTQSIKEIFGYFPNAAMPVSA